MVAIHSYAAAGANTAVVLCELERQIDKADGEADFVFAFFGCLHDAAAIRDFLQNRFPGAMYIGGTSHSGVMTDAGLLGNNAVGILAVEDGEGMYGAAVVPVTDDPAADAEAALHAALAHASCPGELPALIWVYQAPGCEEHAIKGLWRVVGDRCPIVGGSSADENHTGSWRQIGPEGVFENGIGVAVLFPSGGIGTAFQGGFEPTGHSGIVTKASGREIVEIDGRPAVQVYDEWSGNILGVIPPDGKIQGKTAMNPLGIEAGDIHGVPDYLLIHPKEATADGTLTTFAAAAEGVRVHFMRGSKQHLADRAGRVSAQAATRLPDGADSLVGGVMIFCAGCQTAVYDKLGEIAVDIREHFRRRPFLLGFTYGELGNIAEKNVHGNMMISAVAFGR